MRLKVNNLYNLDCMKVLPKLKDKTFDMCITDIPYGISKNFSTLKQAQHYDMGNADVKTFPTGEFVNQVCRLVKGSVYIFCEFEQISSIFKVMNKHGMTTRLGIWQKTNPSPMNGSLLWLSSIEVCAFGRFNNAVFNEHCKGTVWKYSITSTYKIHPTQKPLDLFRYLIETSSNEGDFILDPCMGSGTTAIVCMEGKRRWMGFEMDMGYFDVAIERIRQLERYRIIGDIGEIENG